MVAGADGSTVAAPVLGKPAQELGVPGRSLGSLGERAFRVIGKGFLGLPTSTWLLLDLSILLVGLSVAYWVYPRPILETTPHITLWHALAVFAFALTTAGLVFGLYDRETLLSRSRILTRMLLTVGAATIVAYAITYVIMYATVSRRATCLAMSITLLAGAGIRLGACLAICKVPRGLLVVGPRSLFESFEQAQANGLLSEYRLLGYAVTDNQPPGPIHDRFNLGSITDQIPTLRERDVTDIVVGTEATRDPQVMDWMVPSLQCGCRVTNQAIFYEKATGQILVDEITPSWFLFADLTTHCDRHATVKRVFDLVTAVIGLCLTAPLWPFIALAIKLDSRGPVFYSQNRVGQNGRIFRLYKFRTMRPDAENGRSLWASPNDPRVTRVGRILRRTRLDELPQLCNVLIGQMSVVGPRPERPDIVRELCRELPFYAERHLVKPGITGWAQISFRYGSCIEDAKRKLQFDLYYLKNMSFELDLIILLRTLGTFVRGAC
jgi:sugar transferase (PEP-CTERM system associated)